MKINVKDTAKIINEIFKVEGPRVSVRNLTPEIMKTSIQNIERHLSKILLKKDWKGLKIKVNPHGQSFPNSYKYCPESTSFELGRSVSNWYITSITRGRCYDYKFSIQNLSDKKGEVFTFINKPQK